LFDAVVVERSEEVDNLTGVKIKFLRSKAEATKNITSEIIIIFSKKLKSVLM